MLLALSAAAFLVYFQVYMLGPLLPGLAHEFRVSVETAGLLVPAFLLPYGATTLAMGLLAEHLGRLHVVSLSLGAFAIGVFAEALAPGLPALLALRVGTGLVSSGVVTVSLAFVGDAFPFERRGAALGWLFGAMAGGMAFGSTLGPILASAVGWRGLFLGVAAVAAACWAGLAVLRRPWRERDVRRGLAARQALAVWRQVLAGRRGLRTYAYVLFNGMFYSGTYTWLGLDLERRFGLTPAQTGLALIGYGVPGFLLGPVIGRLADRLGRRRLVPVGVLTGAVSALLLAAGPPLWATVVLVAALSLGYDMTQPLLAGIVTDLHPQRGLMTGMNAFLLFVGFGLGSLVFGGLLPFGIGFAYASFGGSAAVLAAVAFVAFRSEGGRTVGTTEGMARRHPARI